MPVFKVIMSASKLSGFIEIEGAESEDEFWCKVVHRVCKKMETAGIIPEKLKVYVAREYSDCDRIYFYTNNQLYFVRIFYYPSKLNIKVEFSLYTSATEKKEELRIQGILSR